MSRRLAYLRLLRIPNVFTAVADVSVGLVAGTTSATLWIPIIAASAFLYSAGIVWNDYFDRDIDARERPGRPIPSGHISARHAAAIATVCSLIGIASAGLGGWLAASWQPFIVAVLLLGMILAYDGLLKKTPFGTFAMGGCRLLNVFLGFSAVSLETIPWGTRLSVALIVGVYVAGVTLFARDEAGRSRVPRLRWAAAVMFAALFAAVAIPALGQGPGRTIAVLLLALLAIRLAILVAIAIRAPTSAHVQSVVRSAIIGLIVFDAALATALAGPVGLLLLVLLAPAWFFGRWAYST